MDSTTVPSSAKGASVLVERTDPLERQHQHGDMSHIPGWGADKDRADRPGVPMERTPPRLHGVHWDAPSQQRIDPHHEVFHSTERPGITPVYGTSVAPSGLSGRMRALAFRYSESDIRHWMILLAADRVNVGEGLIDDIAHGHVPNILAEMGAAAEWKHNRAGFIRKALVASVVAGGLVYWWRQRRR